MTDDFSYLISKYGFPENPLFINDEMINKLDTTIPTSLLAFWKEVGVGSWRDSAFSFCLPDDFHDLVNSIFFGDAVISPEHCAVFGYSAFGELHIWHRTLGNIDVNLPLGWVQGDFTGDEKQQKIAENLGPDRVIAIDLLSVDEDSAFVDEKNHSLFEQALRKYGKLQKGQCFGFVPALALGGKIRLENVRRLSAPEHFSILAGLGNFTLIKFDDNARRVNIRKIGE